MSNALAISGSGYSNEQIDLIKRTICRGANDDELSMFMMVCNRTGLDPFSRQIHAVKRWNNQTQREEMSIQTGIDGFRLIAERTGKYAGNDDPVYDNEDGQHPQKATVTVWKMVGNQRVPFTRSARWSEFVQTKKDGSPTKFWKQMPYLMLGKVAEALALRTAFPQELSGLYTSEEMGQADNEGVIEAEVTYRPTPKPEPPRQSASIDAKPALPTPQPPKPQVQAESTIALRDSLTKQILDAESEEEVKNLMSGVAAQIQAGQLNANEDAQYIRGAAMSKFIKLAKTLDDLLKHSEKIDASERDGKITSNVAERLRKLRDDRLAQLKSQE